MDDEIAIIQEAFAALKLYRRYYTSGEGYVKHRDEIIALLEHFAPLQMGGGKLLLAVAQGLRAS